ncbi:multicopper oxidase domain-containing protein [Candidatus Nitrotoga sp. M5]|uniref:multicopper oxidase domain-containing protein n=1 Tax=Candidatus Nitrotoga sp. M5 TaxID=2890409 RepID=UPI001EF2B5F3|nr:multicopper oxidase domain-containing protein [Candidatus Nitrotoga sp. M5]CAH1386534.1 Copper-containing nitrite reductase [Candidatus Nitrotoga sp. M5]
MNIIKNTAVAVMMLAGLMSAQQVLAKTVKVTMTAMELDLPVNNKGDVKMAAWTFDGSIPGKPVRVKEGDTIDFTLINPAGNKNSHAMDFHAAQVDVLNEFASIKPGQKKHFKFEAKVPGVFMYHCGASSMVQHIVKGMYGVIIVEPKDTKDYPKADREYILIQQQYFPDTENITALLENKDWKGSLINGKMFHYDPVHEPNATQVLESKPGERVRIFFVNANINNPVALHPIAGIWDRVYINGNPKNTLYGIQTYNVAVASGVTLDIVSPADRPTNVAIVDHAMGAALRGAITVLMNKPDADPTKGRGDEILIR